MYSKIEFGLHGLVALVFLPLLWLKDKVCGFVPRISLQKENLSGYVSIVTGTISRVELSMSFVVLLEEVLFCRH